MAINLEKLINFDLLVDYDDEIKKWINSKITTASGIAFISGALPAQGEENVLYIVNGVLKIWDPSSGTYKDVCTGGDVPIEGDGAGDWSDF